MEASIAIAAGNYHSLGLKADGSIVAWGCFFYDVGQCNVPEPNGGFAAVAARPVRPNRHWHTQKPPVRQSASDTPQPLGHYSPYASAHQPASQQTHEESPVW
jgi:alpha-tubulin suppressor-like RCC1 family protein